MKESGIVTFRLFHVHRNTLELTMNLNCIQDLIWPGMSYTCGITAAAKKQNSKPTKFLLFAQVLQTTLPKTPVSTRNTNPMKYLCKFQG